MYGYGNFAYPHARPTAQEGSQDGLPPGRNAEEGEQPTVPTFQDELQHQDHYHHYYHRYHQHQHQPQQHHHGLEQYQNALFPPPTHYLSPNPSGTSSPTRSIEKLAHKLSLHNLEQLYHDQLEMRRAMGLEPNIQPQQQHMPVGEQQNTGEPIEIDETYLEPNDAKSAVKQPPQPIPSLPRRPLDRAGARSSRLERMIAAGTQCNVRSESRSLSTASRSTPPSTSSAPPDPLKPGPDRIVMMAPPLEADDAESDDVGVTMRYARGPGGVTQYSVSGTALRYRLAADVALRCPNVVRSRPRMRKRNKTRNETAAPSPAVTPAVTSPAVSASPLSPDQPPLYPPPQ